MPADEYTSATGGSLKLKGVNSSSKITKSHKKKKLKADKQSSSAKTENDSEIAQDGPSTAANEPGTADETALTRANQEKRIEEDLEAEIAARNRGKTEAQFRHEEQRRKRVGLIYLSFYCSVA